MFPRKRKAKKALLIRTNFWEEILGSYDILKEIKEKFDLDEVELLTAEDTGSHKFELSDKRYTDVVTFPTGRDKTLFLKLPRLIRKKKYQVVVLVFLRTRPQFNLKYIFCLFLCRGKKYLYLRGQGFVPLQSKQAIQLLAEALYWKLSLKPFILSRKKTSGENAVILQNTPLSLMPQSRILWIRPDYLGDVIMALPALRVLKENFPHAEIDALVREESSALLCSLPEISRIHKLDIFPYSHPALTPKAYKELFNELDQRQYALAIDFRGDTNIWRLLHRLGIPVRVGRIDALNSAHSHLLTHAAHPSDNRMHMVQQNVELLNQIGISPAKVMNSLSVSLQQLQEVESRLAEAGITTPFIVLHARSANSIKEWVPERFAVIADYLINQYGITVLITGSAADKTYNDVILKSMSRTDRVFNMAGWFKLEFLPALLKKADLLVTIDSAPSHIAAAVGTTVIALMLPHLQYSYRPHGECHKVITPTENQIERLLNNGFQDRLLEAISVNDVIREIDVVLRNKKYIL